MIEINLVRNRDKEIVSFTVSGHAGFADKGSDIVCAAVTTAAMTAVNGLTDVAGIEAEPVVREGYLACTLPETISKKKRHDAGLLLDSMVLTFQNLEAQYGKFIKMSETEI